ncbi:hypothetical protein FGO68_gene8239 [Halteria grandinella]|uniref:Uncharacterized protein n=1 Tax=Halteria grandinella TaxID=5974 RepID=A0A8J8SUK2_HALGN|nr:hypothetical protein FGO68_gene8239 [Halteria grandinella]
MPRTHSVAGTATETRAVIMAAHFATVFATSSMSIRARIGVLLLTKPPAKSAESLSCATTDLISACSEKSQLFTTALFHHSPSNIILFLIAIREQ